MVQWVPSDTQLSLVWRRQAADLRDLNTKVPMWAMTGKQCWRCGVLREPIYRSQVLAHTQIPQRVLLALDSRTVAMKVGIR